ncbi:MAG: hypothetical protein DRG58_06000 [Deltaproteobacteria bacterium]|nr:MAG: hypothetical protein DRG58_06000 [Deltaproteobacteria bacterium]
MYVQAAEHFPGIVLLPAGNSIRFDTARFYAELPEMLAHWEEPDYFGMKILDENDRPLIFNDEVRSILMDFMARRVQVQLQRLKAKHPRALMFIDEPGLQFIFSSVSGYTDTKAREDLDRFLAQIDRPRGIHLCGNPDWEFLLKRDLDILSMDIYTNAEIFRCFGPDIRRFVERGAVLSWGIVPTGFEAFNQEFQDHLISTLEDIWTTSAQAGIERQQLVAQAYAWEQVRSECHYFLTLGQAAPGSLTIKD